MTTTLVATPDPEGNKASMITVCKACGLEVKYITPPPLGRMYSLLAPCGHVAETVQKPNPRLAE